MADMIERISRNEGMGMNKTIKKLLAKSLGLSVPPNEQREKEFSDLFGVWSQQEFDEFSLKTEYLGRIDPLDWQ